MSEIFLYTPDANINSMHLKALRAGGYIPVKVSALSAVKQMAAPLDLPAGHAGVIFTAALKALRKSGDFTRRDFGDAVAEALLASGIEARSDETPQAAQPEGQEPGPKGDAQ